MKHKKTTKITSNFKLEETKIVKKIILIRKIEKK